MQIRLNGQKTQKSASRINPLLIDCFRTMPAGLLSDTRRFPRQHAVKIHSRIALITLAAIFFYGCSSKAHDSFSGKIAHHILSNGYNQADLNNNDNVARKDREMGIKLELLMRGEEPTEHWEKYVKMIYKAESLTLDKGGSRYYAYFIQCNDKRELSDCISSFNHRIVNLGRSTCCAGILNSSSTRTFRSDEYGILIFGRVDDLQGLSTLFQIIQQAAVKNDESIL